MLGRPALTLALLLCRICVRRRRISPPEQIGQRADPYNTLQLTGKFRVQAVLLQRQPKWKPVLSQPGHLAKQQPYASTLRKITQLTSSFSPWMHRTSSLYAELSQEAPSNSFRERVRVC